MLTTSYRPAEASIPLDEITVRDLLRRVTGQVPDRIALVDGQAAAEARRRWNYAELSPSPRMWPGPCWPGSSPASGSPSGKPTARSGSCSSFGAALAGVILVTVNPQYRSAELKYALAQSGVAGLIHGTSHRGVSMWSRRHGTAGAGRRAGPVGPGRGYLITGLVLTAAVTAVPLLVMPRAPFPAWLWPSGQWASGTFALLVIAVALWMLAHQARSRPLAIIALAYTAASLVTDWPTLRSAPSALLVTGGDPLRTLVSIGSRGQSAAATLLPALVLLVAAALSFARPVWFSGKLQAG